MRTTNTEMAHPEIWGGIECTINRVKDKFFDQLSYIEYYSQPRVDEIAAVGITKLRFPVLWEKHQPTQETDIDWNWTEQQLHSFKEKNIDVIAGLVHHGSGPSFTNLLDPEFPYLLAEYAKKVAIKFPWLTYYTPVNEPLTTARFSGLYGLWYPHSKNDHHFLQMLLNQLKGVVLSMREIRKINPVACLVQTEDLGKIYSTPLLQYQANLENERRWLTYDLLCGRVNEKHRLWKYFMRSQIPESELQFFLDNPCTPDVFGFNHYITSERYLDHNLSLYPRRLRGGNNRHRYIDVEVARVEIEQETGVKILLTEAWNRYHQPMALTEVHLHCHREEQLRWFKYMFNACTELMQQGIAIKAITSWAMLGSHGWNKLLTKPKGDYEPGVYDLRGGQPRATALAAFIKNKTTTKADHHLSVEKGWWQRDSRLLYKVPDLSEAINNLQKTAPVLIIGKRGTLGRAFGKVCTDRAINFKLLSRQECDIAEPHTIETVIQQYKPWAIINAAGYVRVDEAETDAENCYRENGIGAYNLACACERHGVQLASFSSDLVFNGAKRTPYVESDKTEPLNVYGRSKAFSEEHVLLANANAIVIRTSAFFSPWDRYNFLHWVEESLIKGEEINVANDVFISPTYVPDLVNTTLDLLIDEEKGIWHLANKGEITWADLAYLTAKKLNFTGLNIKAVPSAHLALPAPRPLYTVLGTEKGHLLPSLSNALDRYFYEKNTVVAIAD